MSTTSGRTPGFTVAVLGACGGIGQPLSLLMKTNPLVKELRLYDVANTAGVTADLSHISSRAEVKAFTGPASVDAAVTGIDLAVIPAGIPRKPGMTRDDLFNINAGIVATLIEAIAKGSPKALIAIISNPVNSTVPIAAEVLKKAGVYDPKRLFGVTTLDVVRAETFVGQRAGVDPTQAHVTVIGGHAGITILPLLSSARPAVVGTPEEIAALTTRIQNAGTEVVEAKAGAGSATLSMAHAAARFANSLLRALAGERGIVEATFVQSEVVPGVPFFASPVALGPEGITEFLPLPPLSETEKKGLEDLKAELNGSIEKGVAFVAKRG